MSTVSFYVSGLVCYGCLLSCRRKCRVHYATSPLIIRILATNHEEKVLLLIFRCNKPLLDSLIKAYSFPLLPSPLRQIFHSGKSFFPRKKKPPKLPPLDTSTVSSVYIFNFKPWLGKSKNTIIKGCCYRLIEV